MHIYMTRKITKLIAQHIDSNVIYLLLQALDNQTFSVLVLAFWLMTLVVGPILAFTYKRSRRTRHYKCRTIQSTKPDTDFRILVCIHSMRNVSGMINLLQNSNPTQLSPINVFAVHLVELTGRSSAMLIVHDTYSSTNKGVINYQTIRKL